jgi:hypothetical protein
MSCTTTPRNVSSVHCSRELFSTLLADPHRAIDRSWCTKRTTEPTLTAERWFLSVCYRKAHSGDHVGGSGLPCGAGVVMTIGSTSTRVYVIVGGLVL